MGQYEFVEAVSKAFARDELEAATLALARRVARPPTMAARLIKDAPPLPTAAAGVPMAANSDGHRA